MRGPTLTSNAESGRSGNGNVPLVPRRIASIMLEGYRRVTPWTKRRSRPSTSPLGRRRFVQWLAGVSGTLVCCIAFTGKVIAQAPYGGRLALPRARHVALVRPDGSDDQAIVSLQPGEFVADVALSPDGNTVAFGLFTARTGDGPGGSDILIAAATPGAERVTVAPRDRPGMLLAAPYWAPDGSGLIFEAVGLGPDNQPTISAEWINLDGSGRRTVAGQARFPSISPDGAKVAYVLARQTGDALVEQPLAGGAPREIIPEGSFLTMFYPRYSPDGSVIAFAGVDDSVAPGMPPLPGDSGEAPGLSGPVEPATGLPKLASDVGSWRGVAAHGFPAAPWVVPVAGGEPRQLAPLPIDDAAIAWSPDGKALASSGASGIFLIRVDDGSWQRVSENGSFGAIDWR